MGYETGMFHSNTRTNFLTDQDGYLLVEEVQAVIDSYNMVYKLNIPQSAITEAFKCCSNGMLVDFDTFLRIVATKRA